MSKSTVQETTMCRENRRMGERLGAAVPFAAMFFFTSTAICYGEESSLDVEIKPLSATAKSGQLFSVNTKVKNVARRDQELDIWSCSYPEHWTADNPAVLVEGVECEKNALLHVILMPGEAYERALSLRVWAASKLSEEAVAFRLAFTPWIKAAAHADRANIWSNAVTVNVKE